MTEFKDLNIVVEDNGYVGNDIEIHKVFNRKILVHKFKIGPTKFDKSKGNGLCLTLQITIDDAKRIMWTGSVIMQKQILQVKEDAFPVTTTIVKEGDAFMFT